MPHNIELIIALVVPLIVLTVFRINAAMAFMSLALGFALVELVGKDAYSFVTFLSPGDSLGKTTWQLILLLTPFILTCIFMVFSIHGRLKTLLNILPAAAVSAMGVLMAVPLLTSGLKKTIQAGPLWQQLSRAQTIIVISGAIVSLVMLWTQRRHAKKSERSSH